MAETPIVEQVREMFRLWHPGDDTPERVVPLVRQHWGEHIAERIDARAAEFRSSPLAASGTRSAAEIARTAPDD